MMLHIMRSCKTVKQPKTKLKSRQMAIKSAMVIYMYMYQDGEYGDL